jgi:hypothetical protein
MKVTELSLGALYLRVRKEKAGRTTEELASFLRWRKLKEEQVGRKIKPSVTKYTTFEMPVIYPNGDVHWAAEYTGTRLRKEGVGM